MTKLDRPETPSSEHSTSTGSSVRRDIVNEMLLENSGPAVVRLGFAWVAHLYRSVPLLDRIVTVSLSGCPLTWTTSRGRLVTTQLCVQTGDRAFWETLDFPVSIDEQLSHCLSVTIRLHAAPQPSLDANAAGS